MGNDYFDEHIWYKGGDVKPKPNKASKPFQC